MEKHTAIQSLLREKYAELQGRLTRITRDVRHTEQPPEADAEERATAQENDEVLDGLEQKIRDEMKQIQDALHRLDRGDFGVCEVCGRNIPRRRLQTLPYTSRCVACAEKTAAA